MAIDQAILDIPHCPLCTKQHAFTLTVERSMVIGLALGLPDSTTNYKRFTRFFTCPDQDNMFKATFRLVETPSNRIDDVSAGGAISAESE